MLVCSGLRISWDEGLLALNLDQPSGNLNDSSLALPLELSGCERASPPFA